MAWFAYVQKVPHRRKIRVKVVRKKRGWRPRNGSIIGVFSRVLHAELVVAEFEDRKLRRWDDPILTDSTIYTFARDVRGQRVFCDG